MFNFFRKNASEVYKEESKKRSDDILIEFFKEQYLELGNDEYERRFIIDPLTQLNCYGNRIDEGLPEYCHPIIKEKRNEIHKACLNNDNDKVYELNEELKALTPKSKEDLILEKLQELICLINSQN